MTVGSIFIEHGTQKLFGWFGGHGRAPGPTRSRAVQLTPQPRRYSHLRNAMKKGLPR